MYELIDRNFVVIDFKTTSYDESAEVISASIIDQNGAVLLDCLVLPENTSVFSPIPNFHEITPNIVEDLGVQHYDFISQLEQILLHGDHDYVVAYNAAFESRFIPNHIIQKQEFICAMHIARSFFNTHPSYSGLNNFLKLNGVAALFDMQIDPDEILTSLGDAKICLNVWRRILQEWNTLEKL